MSTTHGNLQNEIHCEHCGLGRESVRLLAEDAAAFYPEIPNYVEAAICCEVCDGAVL